MTGDRRWEGPAAEPVWLTGRSEPVFAFVHAPEAEARQETAVLICPPFGWEEMCSHRARRSWAAALAQAGFPTARIDLPGCGESGGMPGDPDRVQAWIAAVGDAAGWLQQAFAATRVVAIGLGLGGIAATAAACQNAPIDDLILWAVPARGRTMVRELRAYAAIVAARYPEDEQVPAPEDGVEVTGFFMSASTVQALEALDLTKLTVPDPARRRALLIERDELGVDRRLRDHLESAGVAVTVLPATDYGLLMAHPQEAQVPRETIDRSIDWLRAAAPAARPASSWGDAATAAPAATIQHAGRAVTETPLTFATPAGQMFGMLTAPAGGPVAPVTAVLLNAGALRRTGPNHTWVELSRRWAGRGVATVRVDFAGIGDSDGDEQPLVSNQSLYSGRMTDQVLQLLSELGQRGLPERFVLVGLCSGAYWALHAALQDRRVSGAFLINLYSFFWSEALVAERDRRETVAALREGLLKRVARGGISAYHLRRAWSGIRGGLRSGSVSVEGAQETEVGLALDQLRDQETQVLLALSRGEPLYDQFEREGRIARMDQWPNVTLERLPSADHMVRALWIQQRVHGLLDRSLEQVLDGAADRAAVPRG